LNADAVKRGQGSGFLVSPDGMIVTNYHVMRVGRRGLVRFGDGKVLPVESILAQDAKKDLSVLQVSGTDLPYLELLPDEVKPVVGSRAFAIGTPAGYTNTLSEGLVSGLREEEEQRAVVQTTAPISSGSSGGPLLDSRARVLGVNTYVHVEQSAARVIENLNFAVSSREVREVLAKAVAARSKRGPAGAGTPLDAPSASDLAQAYELVGKGRWLDAWPVVNAVRQRNPENIPVLLLAGLCNMHMNFPDEAVKAHEAVVRLKPDEVEGHVGLGFAYLKKKAWKEAADALARAVQLSPEDAAAQQGLGTALLALGRTEEALAALKEAVRLDADEVQAWMALGEAYLALKQFGPAEDTFREVIRRGPENPVALARLGLAACQCGHLEAAMQAAEMALKMQPGLVDAYFVMGLALHRMGNRDQAAQVLELLQTRDPKMAAQLLEATRAGGVPGEEKKDGPKAK
jgi:tetratricopeptide (TPR) repeat protein